MVLQGIQRASITLWKQGLEILTGYSQYDRLFRALHEVGISEIDTISKLFLRQNPSSPCLIDKLSHDRIKRSLPNQILHFRIITSQPINDFKCITSLSHYLNPLHKYGYLDSSQIDAYA